MKNLYVISGLGADERVFERMDFSGHTPIFIQWIPPLKQESMTAYATRLLPQIKSPKPVLMGLSFGGMMACEIARQIETEKVILLASAKTRAEIPFYYRLMGKLSLHKLMSARQLKRPSRIAEWLFGVNSKTDKQLLKAIILDTDPVFLKWALDKIVTWKNRQEPGNVFHIHGTADKILPYRFVRCDKAIEGGGHSMTLDRADELTAIIKTQLDKI